MHKAMLSALRRSLLALAAAGAVALFIKLRGDEETPPNEGGWRELSGPKLD